jgi:hypothetical protein
MQLDNLTPRKSDAKFYHTGEAYKPNYSEKSFRTKAPEPIDRDVIAWDMEGISLSGQEAPQHPVLFGCSKDTTLPLRSQRLSTREMLEYIIHIGEQYPHAIHVGFAFKYDANMIIAGLDEKQIIKLWRFGQVRFRFDEQFVWSIRWVPGKMFTVTRRWGRRRNTRARTSVTIYDYSSFFGGQKFIDAAEQILRDDLSDYDRETIRHGKAQRGQNTWQDIGEIHHYWSREIVLIRRTFETFRKVMYDAGFALREWYGPGALANYINASRGLRQHLAGVQTTSGILPEPVHFASKVAFSGGRFELFRAGRIPGPVYAIDINSAYPYALTKLPSFERGKWVHIDRPGNDIKLFGIYRIKYTSSRANPFQFEPQPLFYRDNRGLISYPDTVHGWYYSPEAAMVRGMPGVEIIEGWYWETESEERPWAFLEEMYRKRMSLKSWNPLLAMPFKLGPNSLYGKYAQTVGWNKEKMLPPKSHALPVAGWVTSYCRAMLYAAIRQDPASVIAVETDAVYSTRNPEELNLTIGDGLGEWDYKTYEEMIYFQSGMYHIKENGRWKGVKSRGMNRGEFPIEKAEEYLGSLVPGEPWGKLALETRPRFIGAGAALASKEPLKEIMGSWRVQTRHIGLGDTGKRVHSPLACAACSAGIPPDVGPHRLFVHSRSDGEVLSTPRYLPWEKGEQLEAVSEIKAMEVIESDLVWN